MLAEDMHAVNLRRERLWHRLREIFWDSHIRSIQFEGDLLVVSCRRLPAKITRCLVIGNHIAIWRLLSAPFDLSFGEQGHIAWPACRVAQHISDQCKRGEIPPDDVLLHLGHSHFPSCDAISLIGHSLVVELPPARDRDHRHRIRLFPKAFNNLPFDVRYHNGPLPNTPDVSEIMDVDPDLDHPSSGLFLDCKEWKIYICDWEDDGHVQKENENGISPWESLDEMGLILSARWERCPAMNEAAMEMAEAISKSNSETPKPKMIPLKTFHLGEHFLMYSTLRPPQRVIYHGIRITSKYEKQLVFLCNSDFGSPELEWEEAGFRSAVFVRDIKPGQARDTIPHLGEVGALMLPQNLEEKEGDPCVRNCLIYANQCDELIRQGFTLSVVEPERPKDTRKDTEEHVSERPKKRQKLEPPYHSSRFL